MSKQLVAPSEEYFAHKLSELKRRKAFWQEARAAVGITIGTVLVIGISTGIIVSIAGGLNYLTDGTGSRLKNLETQVKFLEDRLDAHTANPIHVYSNEPMPFTVPITEWTNFPGKPL